MAKNQKITQNKKRSWVLNICIICLCIHLFSCIYPLVWLLINSFKSDMELFLNPWGLPKEFTLENFKKAIVDYRIFDYFGNSVLLSAGTVFFTIVLSLMASFGLTRLKWKYSTLTLDIFLLGLMIPAYGCLIPMYSIFMKMGLLNNRWSVIIASVTFSLPTSILIMTGFFLNIPSGIEEAAVIDGCDAKRTFLTVDCPIVAPGIVTIAIITFVGAWNDLLYSQIFLTSTEKMPLTLGLMRFSGVHSTDYAGMIAAVIITIIPVVIVYIVLHKYIIEGMITGAVKG